jgi:hypothetical protein
LTPDCQPVFHPALRLRAGQGGPIYPQRALFAPEPKIGPWNIWPATHLAQALIETGERELMLQTLKNAIDRGWMFYSVMLIDSPILKDYRDDPELQALVDTQAARMAAQRAWYEEHKDEPLF